MHYKTFKELMDSLLVKKTSELQGKGELKADEKYTYEKLAQDTQLTLEAVETFANMTQNANKVMGLPLIAIQRIAAVLGFGMELGFDVDNNRFIVDIYKTAVEV